MNIGIVCYPTFGGSGVVATNLAIKLSQIGHKVHLISYNKPFRLKGDYSNLCFHKVNFINYYVLPYPEYTFSLSAKILRLVKEYNLEIIHLHYFIPHHLPALLLIKNALKNLKIKVIVTLHGTDTYLLGKNKELKELAKHCLENSDGITTVSNYLKNYTKKYFSLEKEIKVIPNFVDIKEFKPFKNKKIKEKALSLLHISNFRPIKNVSDIIKAFKIITEYKKISLLLIGDGPQKEDIRNLVNKLNLTKKVIFDNSKQKIAKIISKSSIFILSSKMESFGLAALEAMSCGLPIVAYKVGGLPEVIAHNKNGFLVKKDNVQALAEAVLKILQSKTLFEKFSINSREIVISSFNEDKIVKEYEEYYLKIKNLC
ncbi:MAG: N-acetyl-alpha-D-glucosaminyl L-malate synthase BshA [bacterium]|nr:N-acetyl-alpha-D-glucosaminyl L-malate synthase BshA [bacterium]